MLLKRILRCSFSNSKYDTTYKHSIEYPVEYWREEAKSIKWKTFPKTTLRMDDLNFHRWFPDGELNITEQCLDVNLEQGRGSSIAYYVESPITGQRSTITYHQLHKRVEEFAGGLIQNFKIKPGDRVIIYMPMVIESIVAILACARIGAVHIVVFGGFSAIELANRIKDSQPKLIICANAGKQPGKVLDYNAIVDHALKDSNLSNFPKVIFHRDLLPKHAYKQNEHDFLKIQKSNAKRCGPIYLNANHPLYILYTSGTTGKPKGVIRDHGGTAVILQHAMKHIYNMKPGEGMFCSSDIGWVLGHSFIIYAPLIAGIRSVFFQGKPVGTPNADVFWEILSRHKINHLYTSPTAIRTIRKEDSNGDLIQTHDLSHLKCVTLVGQRCDIPTFEWVQKHLEGKLVNDCYWQTETGGPILSNYMGFPTFKEKPGSACKPLPGYNVQVRKSDTGELCKPDEPGTIFIKKPLPPSFMLSILNNDDKYVEKYFTTLRDYYNTGDSGYYDNDGYYYVMSREDDVINTAGHRLSTGEMEEVLMKHEHIAQAIVVGVHDEIKGEIPIAFVTIKTNVHYQAKNVSKQTVQLVRQHIGPVASFKVCHVVPRLPKTRSGKYLRHIVRKMYNQQKYDIPSTVEDIDVVYELQAIITNIHKENSHK